MKRRLIYGSKIAAAEGNDKQSDAFADMLHDVEDDFDYIVAGLEKLGREGATGTQNGMVILESLKGALDQVITRIADEV